MKNNSVSTPQQDMFTRITRIDNDMDLAKCCVIGFVAQAWLMFLQSIFIVMSTYEYNSGVLVVLLTGIWGFVVTATFTIPIGVALFHFWNIKDDNKLREPLL